MDKIQLIRLGARSVDFIIHKQNQNIGFVVKQTNFVFWFYKQDFFLDSKNNFEE